MTKKLLALVVLSGSVGTGVYARSAAEREERADASKVQAVIDARLHALVVQLNAERRR